MTDQTEGVGTPTPLTSFYVTFGVGYHYTEHPYWPGAHPDGYLEVVAPDEEAARALVRSYIGLKWSHLYDRKPKWTERGALAMISTDGTSWSAAGVAHPTPKFREQDAEYHGHESGESICARIEGTLIVGSDQDAIENLGYEAEFVHHSCFTEGVALFAEVTDVDYRVLAGEFDWSEPGQYQCAVCEGSII